MLHEAGERKHWNTDMRDEHGYFWVDRWTLIRICFKMDVSGTQILGSAKFFRVLRVRESSGADGEENNVEQRRKKALRETMSSERRQLYHVYCVV